MLSRSEIVIETDKVFAAQFFGKDFNAFTPVEIRSAEAIFFAFILDFGIAEWDLMDFCFDRHSNYTQILEIDKNKAAQVVSLV